MITVYVIESMADQTWYTGMAMDPADSARTCNISTQCLYLGCNDFA